MPYLVKVWADGRKALLKYKGEVSVFKTRPEAERMATPCRQTQMYCDHGAQVIKQSTNKGQTS